MAQSASDSDYPMMVDQLPYCRVIPTGIALESEF